MRPRGRLPWTPDGFYYSIIQTVLNGQPGNTTLCKSKCRIFFFYVEIQRKIRHGGAALEKKKSDKISATAALRSLSVDRDGRPLREVMVDY